MKLSKYKAEQVNYDKKEAFRLYKTGLSLRAVADITGYSHEWIRKACQDLSTGKLTTLDKE